LNKRYTRLAYCNTVTRPNISLRGASTKGPWAYPSKKIVMTSWRIKPAGMLNSSPITVSTGVTIVEENGDIKVKSDTRIVVIHFCLLLQFSGLLGSLGPSQVTYLHCQ
jgi:hypothetical protein